MVAYARPSSRPGVQTLGDGDWTPKAAQTGVGGGGGGGGGGEGID